MPGARWQERLALTHGLFYLITGVWPLVDIRSFEAVTGPKVDRWLVKTVGVVIAAIGGGLTLASRRSRVTPEIVLIGTGAAAGLTAIDVVYASRGRISRIYFLDAIAEIGLIAAWVIIGRGIRGSKQ